MMGMGTSCGLWLLLVCFTNVVLTGDPDKLTIEYTSQYNVIWTGPNNGISLWTPAPFAADFFAVADCAVEGTKKPTNQAVLVKDTKNGLVKPPSGFKEVWNDKGSGATKDVTIFEPYCDPGYISLGSVAVPGFSGKPDAKKYRCVRSDLLVSGFLLEIWNTKRTKANSAASLWSIQNDPANPAGVWPVTFIVANGLQKPSKKPWLLDSKKVIVNNFDNSSQIAIMLYETNDAEMVWSDQGSGSKNDISIWKPISGASLGFIAVNSYRAPPVVNAKGLKPGALARPQGFTKIWDDSLSKALKDVSLWSLRCPPGTAALGAAVSRSHNTEPSADVISCVNMDYLAKGKWVQVWKDVGSGALKDVGVFKAVPADDSGQGINAMSATKGYGAMQFPAFVLKKSCVRAQNRKPSKSAHIYDVKYRFQERAIMQSDPINMGARTTVDNCVGSGSALSVTRELACTVMEESRFNIQSSVEIGVATEMEAGIPGLGGVSVSSSVSFEMSSGKETTYSETKTDTISATLTAKPGTSQSYTMMGTRDLMSIPWEGLIKYTEENGSTHVDKVQGKCIGVRVSNYRVVAEPPESC